MAIYNIVVKPNGTRNSHHIKLRKGANEVGLILCDAQGRKDPKGIQRSSYPRSALKTYSGEEDYADSEPPFRPISQADWSGGRGQLIFEKDTRRFYDSQRADTRHAGKIFLGAQETYCSGNYRYLNQHMPGDMNWQALTGTTRYMAAMFLGAAYTASRVEVYLRRVGSPGTAVVSLYISTAIPFEPDSILAGASYNVTTSEITDTVSVLYSDAPGTPPLLAVTRYWVVVYGAATDDADNHWEIAHDATVASCKVSSDGSTWSSAVGQIYYRVLDNSNDLHGRKFEYKRAVYLVTQPETGNSYLFINGSRGVADDNAGNKDRLNDATVAAAADWHCTAGAIVLITKGPGSEEAQPWREIASVNAGYLEVTQNWNVTHTTETEYVILGSNEFTSLGDLGGYVTDVYVTDELIYFARGDTSGLNILRYQYYNNAGVWDSRNAAEGVASEKLLAIEHPIDGTVLWGANNDHAIYGTAVFRAIVPPGWGKLYRSITQLAATNEPWDAWAISNVTQSLSGGLTRIAVGAGFTTGIAAVENLPDAVDITKANALAVRVRSSVACNANDVQLILDDQANLGKAYSPVGLKLDGTTDMDNAKDGDAGTAYTLVAMTTANYIYVGFSKPFGKITVDMGGTVNAVVSALTAQYFNGSAWAAVTITDGTSSGGKTLAQDGDITFTTPQDWEESVVDSGANALEAYWIRLKVSVNLTGNIQINEITVTRKNNITLNLPALVANEWVWCAMDISPLEYPLPNYKEIRSVAIQIAVDNGAQTIDLAGGVQAISYARTVVKMSTDARIIGLQAYAGGETERRKAPWIITESGFGEIQQSETDPSQYLYVPVVLEDLAGLRSETNGKAHAVGGKYLWFNVGERVVRYFNELLEDVGPTLDEGLPEDRRGDPVRLRAYPGEMLLALDGRTDKYSSILSHTNGGWHEVYRSHRTGARIYDCIVQAIPGAADRLWVCQGGDILWLPIDVNPLSNSQYRYTHEAVVHSSRVHGGMQDVLKFWKSLKLVTQSLGTNGRQVWGDYRLEGETAWTTLPHVFEESIFQEINLTNDYSASGRFIEIRVRLQTGSASYTPIINGWVLETLMRFDVKWAFSLNVRLANHDTDLLGRHEPISLTDKRAILDGWLASPTPLFVEAFRDDLDGAVAYIEPIPERPLRTVIDPEDVEKSRLVDIAQVMLIGI